MEDLGNGLFFRFKGWFVSGSQWIDAGGGSRPAGCHGKWGSRAAVCRCAGGECAAAGGESGDGQRIWWRSGADAGQGGGNWDP